LLSRREVAMPTTISGLIRLIVAAFFIADTIIASGAL
jgi:hypothetical protein